VHIENIGRCVLITGSTFEFFWPNQQFKLTVASWVRYALQVVGFRFCYSVFSTYNYDTYQFGYQHELVSLGAL
jgi:hypothetical protein